HAAPTNTSHRSLHTLFRSDYVNFGFDEADVLIAVGYEPQEFDPAKVNPDADKKIIHIHQFPAEVDEHYPVEVGVQGDVSRSLHRSEEHTSELQSRENLVYR